MLKATSSVYSCVYLRKDFVCGPKLFGTSTCVKHVGTVMCFVLIRGSRRPVQFLIETRSRRQRAEHTRAVLGGTHHQLFKL